MQALGYAADVIQLLTFVFAIVALLKARAAYVRYLRRARASSTNRPVSLAVGIGGDISGSVKKYWEDQNIQMHVEPIFTSGYLKPDQIEGVLAKVARTKQSLTESGITELCLFYKGPVTVATGLGMLLSNWVPVKVYELNGGTYTLAVTLDKAISKALLYDDVKEAARSLLTGHSD
jgi:hypothetical protein